MSKSHVAGRPSEEPTPAQLKELFAQIESGRVTKSRLQAFLRGATEEVTISQRMAHAILGTNFFGAGEWALAYDVDFTKKQFREVAEFPWSEEVLLSPDPWEEGKTIKETHFGFLGVEKIGKEPLNLPKLHVLHPGPKQFYWDWYLEHGFAQETCQLRWYLMRIGIVPESRSLSYSQQVAMLPDSYEVPLAIERVTANVLFYQKNGVYLDQEYWARCQDETDHGHRVYVGRFGGDGLGVSGWSDGAVRSIGMAASRKIPS